MIWQAIPENDGLDWGITEPKPPKSKRIAIDCLFSQEDESGDVAAG